MKVGRENDGWLKTSCPSEQGSPEKSERSSNLRTWGGRLVPNLRGLPTHVESFKFKFRTIFGGGEHKPERSIRLDGIKGSIRGLVCRDMHNRILENTPIVVRSSVGFGV